MATSDSQLNSSSPTNDENDFKINKSVAHFAKELSNASYRSHKSASEVVFRTVASLKDVIMNDQWTTAKELIDLIHMNGDHLMEADPSETCTSNMIKRILHIIREEYIEDLESKTVEKDTSNSLKKTMTSERRTKDIDYSKIVPTLKTSIIDHINEFVTELETCKENIIQQAKQHLHANEIIMTLGYSKLVEDFLKKAAETRTFEVIVAAGVPLLEGHDMASNLSKANIQTTLISDAAIFAMMSRVNKVIIGTNAVMASGGLRAYTGSHTLALAANYYSIPVIVLVPLYKLCPMEKDAFEANNYFHKVMAPTQGIVNPDDASLADRCTIINPVFDYVPPELVTLFISDRGGNAPSYFYRYISELYHPADHNLNL
ncbi:hypothetical protein TKK_0007184 [Trichogramma kaykai]|uniref:Translation initiation factor eIF2B subunit beta n=1 Tax=Trichogramma kaykai TaxID=54128 RepID=A0ABD2X9H6_9HYME